MIDKRQTAHALKSGSSSLPVLYVLLPRLAQLLIQDGIGSRRGMIQGWLQAPGSGTCGLSLRRWWYVGNP